MYVWPLKPTTVQTFSQRWRQYWPQCVEPALRGILCDLDIFVRSVILFEDNQSTICIANKRDNSKRTKHIDVKYHFVREKVEEGIIDLQYVPTECQIAVVFTKALDATKFVSMVLYLSLENAKKNCKSSNYVTALREGVDMKTQQHSCSH